MASRMVNSNNHGARQGGSVSPSNAAKPSQLLSQIRTTSNGSGRQANDSGMAASPADYEQAGEPYNKTQTGFSSTRTPAALLPKTNGKGSNTNPGSGLNMSQTRTTTHTSNQHNSGGNVAATTALNGK